MKLKYLVLSFVIFLAACSTVEKSDPKLVAAPTELDNQSWNLVFFSFNNGKQTNKETFQYSSRRACYEAMFKMEVDARKQSKRSGAGMCTKWFVDGQVKTKDDMLGYK
jgi:hypothetical protein